MRNFAGLLFAASLWACLFPCPAAAIPTPDSLIVAGSILPYLAGLLASAALGGVFLLRRLLKKAMTKEFLWTVCAVTLLLSASLWLLLWHKKRKQNEFDVLGLYYRGDAVLDLFELEAVNQFNKWNAVMKPIYTMKTVRELLDTENVDLIAIDRSRLAYDSGMPAIGTKNKRRIFRHLWPSEVDPYVARLAKDRSAAKRVLIFANAMPFYGGLHFEKNARLAANLKKFKRVYFLHSKLYVQTMRFVVRDLETGELRLADPNPAKTLFPLRKELWLIDGSAIDFPNVDTILSIKRCAELVKDPETSLVVAHNSLYRPANLFRSYLEAYLLPEWRGNLPERILTIDFGQSNIDAVLDLAAVNLRGKRFVVLALNKHDWIYLGLNAAWRTFLKTRDKPEDFKYEGGCPWLPEVGAQLALMSK